MIAQACIIGWALGKSGDIALKLRARSFDDDDFTQLFEQENFSSIIRNREPLASSVADLTTSKSAQD